MKFTIYQMPTEVWHARHLFFSPESDVYRSEYEAVYQGELEGAAASEQGDPPYEALNELFRMFNVDHPSDYRARSLSAGDVVGIGESYYLCCMFGWHKLDERFHEQPTPPSPRILGRG